MNVLVWGTTFGGDLWSFTRYLSARADCRVRVGLLDPRAYLREPVAKIFPMKNVRFFRGGRILGAVGAPFTRPDVMILDGRTPSRTSCRKGLVLWHGFGWKGPNDREEMKELHGRFRKLWGDTFRPNPDFRWQCVGPWDFKHRTEISGFHPDNCVITGSAIHDDLRTPLPKEALQPYYPFDVVNRKTVLLAPTWHYGEVFAHWGGDRDILDRLLRLLRDRKANVILRMHDSFRYPRQYLQLIEGLRKEHPDILVKFKDRSPDNLVDLSVSDVLLSNFSGIINHFYATLRPVVHIYPVSSADEAYVWRRYERYRVTEQKIDSVRYIWKLPPEDNGGLLARSPEEMLGMIDTALSDPDCCREKTREFLDRHMMGADGRSCERLWRVLQNLVGETSRAR